MHDSLNCNNYNSLPCGQHFQSSKGGLRLPSTPLQYLLDYKFFLKSKEAVMLHISCAFSLTRQKPQNSTKTEFFRCIKFLMLLNLKTAHAIYFQDIKFSKFLKTCLVDEKTHYELMHYVDGFFFFFFINGNTERAQCALSRVCIP